MAHRWGIVGLIFNSPGRMKMFVETFPPLPLAVRLRDEAPKDPDFPRSLVLGAENY